MNPNLDLEDKRGMYAIWQDAFWRLVPGTKRAKEAFVRLAGVVELLIHHSSMKSHRVMNCVLPFEKNCIGTVQTKTI